MKNAPCRCCPGALSLEETYACCYTDGAGEKWWLRPVARRTLPVFSGALIYLSYTAWVVLPHGIAPWSLAYRARALLLSYGRKEKWSPDEVMLPGLPDVSRLLYF
jgi:hypothetical protein